MAVSHFTVAVVVVLVVVVVFTARRYALRGLIVIVTN